jgi:predicted  nucleic acid-binding Zn-ribbon protein
VKELLADEEQNLTKNKDARENLLGRIPNVLRLRYERIYDKRALQGVAFLRDGICQACMRTVPPELFNRVCKGELVEQCPACQRLLVVDLESSAAAT